MNTVQILLLATLLLFSIKTLRDAMYFLWLFQTKEYRLDRTRSFIRENVKLDVSDLLTALGTFFMLGIFFPATAKFVAVFIILLAGYLAPLYFLAAAMRTMKDIFRHALKRPKLTLKMSLIVPLFFISYVFFIYLITAKIFAAVLAIFTPDVFVLFSAYLLLLNLIAPIFILLAIVMITPVTDFQKRRIVNRASLKMAGMKKLRTIGITGSYGKTSTKEFLFAILSQKYKVVKTAGNNNTLMGVANTILGDVTDDYDFFICEMGAYKLGEVKEICALAKPFAGIITGINEQHMDLFGGIENTKRAKYELVQSLPKHGFAVMNREIEAMKPMLGQNVQDTAYYGVEAMSGVRVSPEFIEFTYQDIAFKANILGKHYLGNLLAAIITAEKLGMSLPEISTAVGQIGITSDYLMQKLDGPRGSIFIDDSYSANPTGVLAALEYLREAYPDKNKILVFPGIIELGEKSAAIHEAIWKKTNEVCQFAYILQKDNKSAREAGTICQFVFEKDFDKMQREIEPRIDKDAVLLFESRGAGVVMKKLLENKGK